jgi:hypothetical protein
MRFYSCCSESISCSESLDESERYCSLFENRAVNVVVLFFVSIH